MFVFESEKRMIQSKCAELLFLIGCVSVCGSGSNSKSNFVHYSLKNNKPFVMNRHDNVVIVAVDDFIGSINKNNNNKSNAVDDDRFIFTTMRC